MKKSADLSWVCHALYGGAIYCDEKDKAIVYIQDDAKIYGNTATEEGGGIYVYNGYLYIEGGEITDNHAKYGGGIYVDDHGKMFVGGDVKVTDNNVGNLYISNKDRNLHNACGQDSSPDKPLTEGAIIGISASDSNDVISGDYSRFKEGENDKIILMSGFCPLCKELVVE